MSIHVFTYGSLMFDRVWSKVVGDVWGKTDARLYGYKRRKIRGAVYPALVPGIAEDYVDGIVYLNVGKSDIEILDNFEGEHYQKETVECKLTDGSKIIATVYVFKEEHRNLIEDEEWDPIWFSEVGICLFLTEYDVFS